MDTLEAFNGDTYLAEEFLHLRDKYGIKSVIETGSYLGVTTLWLSEHFEQVFTIEINERYYQATQKRIRGIKNVVSMLGDSEKMLHSVLQMAGEKVIVFLDAHWNKNPLLTELDIIQQSELKPVVVIHDFKVPGHPEFGYDTYLEQNIIYEWDYIKDHVSGYKYYYNQAAAGAKRGVIFLIPNE